MEEQLNGHFECSPVEKLYKCQYCETRNTSNNIWAKFIGTHIQRKNANTRAINYHIEVTHEESQFNEYFQCDKCFEVFYTKGSISGHVNCTHIKHQQRCHNCEIKIKLIAHPEVI